MKINLLVASCTVVLIPSWAQAESDEKEEKETRHHQHLSYSYIEASFLEYDMDIGGMDIEPDGRQIELSVSLGDSLFGVIDRKKSDGNFGGSDYDFDSEGYGFGFHGESWFASYTYNTWELGNDEFDVDTIRLGFRNQWTERIEFNASYTWNNIEDADNDDGFQVGFAFEIANNLHIIADYETIGGHFDIDAVSAGLRLSF